MVALSLEQGTLNFLTELRDCHGYDSEDNLAIHALIEGWEERLQFDTKRETVLNCLVGDLTRVPKDMRRLALVDITGNEYGRLLLPEGIIPSELGDFSNVMYVALIKETVVVKFAVEHKGSPDQEC